MLTMGFNSVTVGFSQYSFTVKPCLGSPKCVEVNDYFNVQD